MDLSLFYFADDSEQQGEGGCYELLMEGAKFADTHGFSAVWTPERHFHPFGGMYPNPAVLGAAVAAVTERVAVRAGSVVAPLHHAARIAEEWSVVDNLSAGRVGAAFASGWNALDFALDPEAYDQRRELVSRRVDEVRMLWRGEALDGVDGKGRPARIRSYPRPVQEELPVWITSSGSIDTFREAARLKAGLLTHLLGQDLDVLAKGIAEYRRVAADEHDGWTGHVALMVHTFVGDDLATVKEVVRAPLTAYLRSSIHLFAKAFLGDKFDIGSLREGDVNFLAGQAFERYFHSSGLFGSVEDAFAVLERIGKVGVDEVACLIDFGVATKKVIEGFEHLDLLRARAAAAGL
ncbi:MupA/Atu3671 family FMN-dependent luciferase-like monooxygenase [Streptomyces halstedii]|uniref:MupA/Atu3671 family FMN-dependent luciferase-like monooxygenase n=1 Tax=Streptomyces halstedii TaxID=1944 RepID=UPI00382F0EF7